MRIGTGILARLALVACLLAALAVPAAFGGGADSLRILLTNDDGFDSPGIAAMRGALLAAGFDVTVVAPRDEQSGKGGSLDTNVFGFVDAQLESGAGEPAVWSVDSTPGDAVRAGLGAVMADAPPDLIVSGANFGQNLGQPATSFSGTIGAALVGLFSDVPAIAVSVGIDLREAAQGFPSTTAAFAPTGAFTARLVQRLVDRSRDGRLLPPHSILNVNVPVPYEEIAGVMHTRLARRTDLEFVWQDPQDSVAAGGGPLRIGIRFPPGPDVVPNADTDAFRAGYLSITVLDGDMTSNVWQRLAVRSRLRGLTP